MKVSFLGAVQTVTGSKYLVESKSGTKILVDCGLFQGLKALRLRNWENFPVDPKSITAIVLTHAHIDHSGYIPRLVKQGFAGKIFCTNATKALAEILLRDSARLKEEEADFANRKHFSKHQPALALYTEDDVEASLPLFESKNLKEEFWIDDLRLRFSDAGHVLGAASVKIINEEQSILFSGDLGRLNDPIMNPPHAPLEADYYVMESTYGDRLHNKSDPVTILQKLVEKICQRKSVLLIPAFALGRAQLLMYYFSQIFSAAPHLKIPMYLNSPMALEITKLYLKFANEHKLSTEEFQKIIQDTTFIHSIQESKSLNLQSGPMIIISASGMLTGGRILHHLDAFGDDPNNIVLLAGYQTAGTRGAALMHGERSIKYFGYYHEVKAEIENPNIFSAHADQSELIGWLKQSPVLPKKILLTHGEPEAADVLRRKIVDELKVDACAVSEGMVLDI